jgi:hypothetical protein
MQGIGVNQRRTVLQLTQVKAFFAIKIRDCLPVSGTSARLGSYRLFLKFQHAPRMYPHVVPWFDEKSQLMEIGIAGSSVHAAEML